MYLWLSPLRRARRAARSRNWLEAAAAYRSHLERAPHDVKAWVQLGHNLKEQGELEEAGAAYRQAMLIAPGSEDAAIHLAHVERRRGNIEASIQVLQHALAHVADPHNHVVRELVEMGARDRLPVAIQQSIEVQEGIYARSRYGLYRAAMPRSSEPTAKSGMSGVVVVIDARGIPREHAFERLAATRATLLGVPCIVLADEFMRDVDAIFVREVDSPAASAGAISLLLVEAGCRVEPDAIEHLQAALNTTEALAAYCDHDHWSPSEKDADPDVDGRLVGHDPCFQPMFDPLWFRSAQVQPPCMLVASAAISSASDWGMVFARRLFLAGTYAHVPLILASRHRGEEALDECRPAAVPAVAESSIQVIIQTRDAPEMLERCVESLLRTAARRDLLDLVIVDNRSVLPRTEKLLRQWSSQGIVRVMPHDEPFNWARANNLAVPLGKAQNLLFLNNDVEMESAGWDDALRAGFAQEAVGAMGALLLYPDRTIQHAGVVMGMQPGGAVHEGVGHELDSGGPAGRWQRPRLAAAVTGAWLATTRESFVATGGFEERLPVAYNDIDFCLRCRAAGRLVVQASHIVAVHRESATRGSVMSHAQQTRDKADWAWLRDQWGDALGDDPAYNPNWVRTGRPFDALRAPSDAAIARWIEASARKEPWSVRRSS